MMQSWDIIRTRSKCTRLYHTYTVVDGTWYVHTSYYVFIYRSTAVRAESDGHGVPSVFLRDKRYLVFDYS